MSIRGNTTTGAAAGRRLASPVHRLPIQPHWRRHQRAPPSPANSTPFSRRRSSRPRPTTRAWTPCGKDSSPRPKRSMRLMRLAQPVSREAEVYDMTIIAGGNAVGAAPWMSRAELARRPDCARICSPVSSRRRDPEWPDVPGASDGACRLCQGTHRPQPATRRRRGKIREFTSRPRSPRPLCRHVFGRRSLAGCWPR